MPAKTKTATKKRASKRTGFFGIPTKPEALLPEVTKFEELFASVEIRPVTDPGKVKLDRFKIGELESTGYCQVTLPYSGKHFNSLTIRPSVLLASAVASSMIKIDYDLINFEIIVYDDRSSRVYARYSQIIGSRLIAEFTPTATREFFRNLSKLHSYPALPRVKKAS